MICGVLLNHCLTVNMIISKSVCLDTRLRDTSLKRCGVKSQFTNSVSCVSIIGVDASLTTTTHAASSSSQQLQRVPFAKFQYKLWWPFTRGELLCPFKSAVQGLLIL